MAFTDMSIETLNEYHCHGGTQGFYRHHSAVTGTSMQFGVYRPPRVWGTPTPVLYYLAGLTCNEETAAIKSGIQAPAAAAGITVVFPDTSPRATGILDEAKDWDFGTGAGFYIDAERSPWHRHYRMQTYIVDELVTVVSGMFSLTTDRSGLIGHSMGGHGALTLALKFPQRYRSVSAFAPIAAPTQCAWGKKAFTGYLGTDRSTWTAHDATELVRQGYKQNTILIDQGEQDQFLAEQLHPNTLQQACKQADQPLILRMHAGYDHGYYFIQSFIKDHVEHHRQFLCCD